MDSTRSTPSRGAKLRATRHLDPIVDTKLGIVTIVGKWEIAAATVRLTISGETGKLISIHPVTNGRDPTGRHTVSCSGKCIS